MGFIGGAMLGLSLYIVERHRIPVHRTPLPVPRGTAYLRKVAATAFVVWFVPAYNILNNFTYWSLEKGRIPSVYIIIYVYFALALLAVGLVFVFARKTRPTSAHQTPPADSLRHACLMLLTIVWTLTISSSLKHLVLRRFTEQTPMLSFNVQIEFMIWTFILTAYLFVKTTAKEPA